MSVPYLCQAPTSCLPPVRAIRTATEDEIAAALNNLHQLYCPLRFPAQIGGKPDLQNPRLEALTLTDSGYASQNEEEEDDSSIEDANATIRGDTFEKDFAVRWLTSLIARADEIAFSSDEVRADTIDEAAFILSSFSDPSEDGEEEALTRDFSFPAPLAEQNVDVRLNDAPLSSTDHTDVGLQSWGASIILSGEMCKNPARFGLDQLKSGSRIIELGAGTGLVGLTLAKLLPKIHVERPIIIATDYHPAVLENLQTNVATNFPSQDLSSPPVETALLDWSAPSFEEPLDKPADMLFAADVIYDPVHATWLRDCAGLYLKMDGVFWLIVTVRLVGKFEGIADTVDRAFASEERPKKGGKTLSVLSKERLDKKRGIGRGDETGYNLYKIGWA